MMRDEAAISYTWVMERLRDILGGVKTSNVIIIDRDKGLSAAILDVFRYIPFSIKYLSFYLIYIDHMH